MKIYIDCVRKTHKIGYHNRCHLHDTVKPYYSKSKYTVNYVFYSFDTATQKKYSKLKIL